MLEFMRFMYKRVGKKIQGMAKVLFLIGTAGSVIAGIVMLRIGEYSDLLSGLGCAFLFGGPILSWVSSWILYGFGEIVESAEKNIKRKNTYEQGNARGNANKEMQDEFSAEMPDL